MNVPVEVVLLGIVTAAGFGRMVFRYGTSDSVASPSGTDAFDGSHAILGPVALATHVLCLCTHLSAAEHSDKGQHDREKDELAHVKTD